MRATKRRIPGNGATSGLFDQLPCYQSLKSIGKKRFGIGDSGAAMFDVQCSYCCFCVFVHSSMNFGGVFSP